MSEQVKRGIILMNLGSPDSTEVKDVSSYLKEFLMDARVIDYSYLLRTILVKGLIVPARAAKSAEAYRTIWTKDGSPLVHLTQQLQQALSAQFTEPVEMAMRYGNPSMKVAYDNIYSKYPDIEEIVLIPLYPHYAMSSYETAVVHAEDVHRKNKYPFKIKFVKPFYSDELYINALADSMKPYMEQDYDHILFSYHGLPERQILKTDITGAHCLKKPDCCDTYSPAHSRCYRHQCFTTTALVAAQVGIPKDKFSISFQSRLGKAAWLNPDTAVRLVDMPKEGIKNLLVVCPAFVSDCLETLEEIAIRGKESFLEAGGTSFTHIPCMNLNPLWIKAITTWIDNINNTQTETAGMAEPSHV